MMSQEELYPRPEPNKRLKDQARPLTTQERRQRYHGEPVIVKEGDPPVRFLVGGDYMVVDDRPIEQKIGAVSGELLRIAATWGGAGTILYVGARLFLRWAGV